MYENETIELFNTLIEEAKNNKGDWMHSPVEEWKTKEYKRDLKESNLIQFRRHHLSGGTINFPDCPLKIIRNDSFYKINLKEKILGAKIILSMFYKLKIYFDHIEWEQMKDNLIGNPLVYGLGPWKISELSIRTYYYKMRILEEFKQINSILEIGGGFGGLCDKLFSAQSNKLKQYWLIDLPENLTISYYYLKNCGHPVILAIKDSDVKKAISDDSRKIILTVPWLIPQLPTNIDLAINFQSFQHMTILNLQYYFNNISNIKCKKIFMINRNWKRDKTDVIISEYPVPKEYKLLKKSKYLFYNHDEQIYDYINQYERRK